MRHGNAAHAHQLRQLSSGPRTVYIAFDADVNGSGPRAARRLAQQLVHQGVTALLLTLPASHDPNSFFTAGGDARQFQALLEGARP